MRRRIGGRSHGDKATASNLYPVATAPSGEVVGVYKLGENYPDRGAHVASATYVVAAQACGLGVGATSAINAVVDLLNPRALSEAQHAARTEALADAIRTMALSNLAQRTFR